MCDILVNLDDFLLSFAQVFTKVAVQINPSIIRLFNSFCNQSCSILHVLVKVTLDDDGLSILFSPNPPNYFDFLVHFH